MRRYIVKYNKVTVTRCEETHYCENEIEAKKQFWELHPALHPDCEITAVETIPEDDHQLSFWGPQTSGAV